MTSQKMMPINVSNSFVDVLAGFLSREDPKADLIRFGEFPTFKPKMVVGHPELVHVYSEYIPATKPRNPSKLGCEVRYAVIDTVQRKCIATCPVGPVHVQLSEINNIVNNIDMSMYDVSKSYDGSMLVLYYHGTEWVLSSLGTPNVLSRNRSDLKDAFIECVEQTSGMDLLSFFEKLDKTKVHRILIVNCARSHVSNHTEELGRGYMIAFDMTNSTDNLLRKIDNYRSIEEACFVASQPGAFGFILRPKKPGMPSFLVQNQDSHVCMDIQRLGRGGDGTPTWHDLLKIYHLNNPSHNLYSYVKMNNAESMFGTWSPVRVFTLLFKACAKILNELYHKTTVYNGKWMKIVGEDELDSVTKFHLSQLRDIVKAYRSNMDVNLVERYIKNNVDPKSLQKVLAVIPRYFTPDNTDMYRAVEFFRGKLWTAM